MNQASITVIQAEIKWLEACEHVSEATRMSYAGEARRFREHLGEARVDEVHEITQGDWLAYLGNLTQARSTVITKRANALKPSSALQAARITRSFLRYCWIQRWLDWLPSVGSQRRAPAQAPADFQAPDGLVSFLLDPGEIDDETHSRLRCTVGLAFWGGFRPKEIADLRASDLVLADDGSAMINPAWRGNGVALPSIVVQHLRHYATLRAKRVGPLTADTALIAQLNSAGPVTSSAAWQILKDWTVDHAPLGRRPVSTRAIRETFKQLAGAEAADYILAVEQQSASRRRSGRRSQHHTVSAQKVAADLVQKMAATVAAA